MGYKRMNKEDVYEILRRLHAGQNVTRIAEVENCARKTIHKYVQRFDENGLRMDKKLPDQEKIWEIIETKILPLVERRRPASEKLEPLQEIIRDMIQDSKEPLRQMIRIELPAGLEMQIDFDKVGLIDDPVTGRNRVVFAFCGLLSHSRLPLIQFVYTQDQSSFAESFIDMFEYNDGVTEIQSIDNLKAGVIKPDLYDPKLNRSLQEVIECYGSFIDPCRVGRSKDKGKVERMIPTARELFHIQKRIHSTADIHRLNEQALC